MQQVFTSWSGGKDSCLSCYLATINNLEVRYLSNMITEDGKRSRTHGQTPELLKVQSQAIGIPLVQRRASWASYEVEFKNMIAELLPMWLLKVIVLIRAGRGFTLIACLQNEIYFEL